MSLCLIRGIKNSRSRWHIFAATGRAIEASPLWRAVIYIVSEPAEHEYAGFMISAHQPCRSQGIVNIEKTDGVTQWTVFQSRINAGARDNRHSATLEDNQIKVQRMLDVGKSEIGSIEVPEGQGTRDSRMCPQMRRARGRAGQAVNNWGRKGGQLKQWACLSIKRLCPRSGGAWMCYGV